MVEIKHLTTECKKEDWPIKKASDRVKEQRQRGSH